MESILGSSMWEFLRWLPRFVLALIFSKRWLAEHLEVDIRSRHNPVEIVQPDTPGVRVYLQVRNETHFEIEIDRIVLKFFYGAEMADLMHFRRERLRPKEKREIYLTASIDAHRAATLPFQYQKNSSHCSLQVLVECNSRLHHFRVEKMLEGIKPSIMNEELLREPLQDGGLANMALKPFAPRVGHLDRYHQRCAGQRGHLSGVRQVRQEAKYA